MLEHPPPASKEWTPAERLAIINWYCEITKDRIRRDDPSVPIVAKKAMLDLFIAIAFVASQPVKDLEQYRDVLLKPYDRSKDHHGVLIFSPVKQTRHNPSEN